MPSDHAFDPQQRQAVYRAIAERRDMRHFLPDAVDEDTLTRLLQAAHRAPSVGLMQPWHFIRITDATVRERIHSLVDEERQQTAEALGERGNDFMKLKVEGIRECGELLVVTLREGRERHIFGRRTMPDMDLASASCAIQNLWLAARAEGLGMGWVSLFDPEALRELLGIPEGGRPIAVLCLGHVKAFYDRPMLELEDWTQGLSLEHFVSTNQYHPTED